MRHKDVDPNIDWNDASTIARAPGEAPRAVSESARALSESARALRESAQRLGEAPTVLAAAPMAPEPKALPEIPPPPPKRLRGLPGSDEPIPPTIIGTPMLSSVF